MEATKITCSLVPQTGVQDDKPKEESSTLQENATSLVGVLEDVILQQEQLLTTLLAEQTKLHSLFLDCERQLKAVTSEDKQSHEENSECKSLWTLESIMWEICPPTAPFLLTLKLVGSFNPVLYKRKKFS